MRIYSSAEGLRFRVLVAADDLHQKQRSVERSWGSEDGTTVA